MMTTRLPLLATKLYLPSARAGHVARPRLTKRLTEGLGRALTLISAPAGFGKTTLVSEWVLGSERPAAWLSLDAGDNDPARFLMYLIAALQTVAAPIGQGIIGVLQAPQPPPTEAILTTVLNDIAAQSVPFILVLDDYHVVEAGAVDQGVAFLLEHLPPPVHLVIAAREDPALPLARLRARGQLTELRAADLRFTPSEAAEFLNRVMGLGLTPEHVAALEKRTEGWVAGLQLAALSMQAHHDAAAFIQSFTGSHRFVMDYLLEEVLHQQPESLQTFLLRTSILERLCGPLCEAVLGAPPGSGQATLEALERANLFIVPLDNERRWYRYHHLFADLLRQRLGQSTDVAPLHVRASQWYDDQGLDLEAFQHAAAANDVERATRLVEEKGLPLHFRDAVAPVLSWLGTLPQHVLNARPSLWVNWGSLLLVVGQTTGVEDKLQAAEAVLGARAEPDTATRYLLGRIASARATLALTRYDVAGMLTHSRRALDNLHPANVTARSTALWTQGFARLLEGDRSAAGRAFNEAVALSQAGGPRGSFSLILATIGQGLIQEIDNLLPAAAETYRRVLAIAGAQPLQIVHEAHLGLARVLYEWNDLAAAEQHGEQSLLLARQYERHIDRFVLSEVFLARLKLARGDLAGAGALLAQTHQAARRMNFVYRLPEIAAAEVVVFLRQGRTDAVAAAEELVQAYAMPLSQARVHLAQHDPGAALAALEPWHRQAEARAWQDERLRVRVLQALAYQALGDAVRAIQVLEEALALAEPAGCVRTFVDEGAPMATLLQKLREDPAGERGAGGRRLRPYIVRLLAAFESDGVVRPVSFSPHPMVEPLTQRELDVLRLIAEGLSNLEISERLFLSLDTVKGHNRRIFDKLQAQRRTEAVARARELGLL
jgi:LuxR family maltose regulon positive regulatory protein